MCFRQNYETCTCGVLAADGAIVQVWHGHRWSSRSTRSVHLHTMLRDNLPGQAFGGDAKTPKTQAVFGFRVSCFRKLCSMCTNISKSAMKATPLRNPLEQRFHKTSSFLTLTWKGHEGAIFKEVSFFARSILYTYTYYGTLSSNRTHRSMILSASSSEACIWNQAKESQKTGVSQFQQISAGWSLMDPPLDSGKWPSRPSRAMPCSLRLTLTHS